MTSAITPDKPAVDTINRGYRAVDTSCPDAVIPHSYSAKGNGPPLAHTGADVVHAVTQGGGIRIGIVCSGVESSACGLSYSRLDYMRSVKYHGWMYDYRGIGTAMAGIMVGEPVYGWPAGLAPFATLGIHQLGNLGESIDGATVASAINDAVDAGSHVIILESVSFQYDAGVESALLRAAESNTPVVMGIDTFSPGQEQYRWPLASVNVIGVGPCDGDGVPTFNSDRYPDVDILAPGCGVIRSHDFGRSYQWHGGNVAAAYFAGQLALVRALDVADELPWGHRQFLLTVLRRSCRVAPLRRGSSRPEMSWLNLLPLAEWFCRGTQLPGLMLGHPLRTGGVEADATEIDFDDDDDSYPMPYSPSGAV